MLFSAGNVQTAKFLIQNSAENDALSDEEAAIIRERDLIRLRAMTDYCKTTDCLRARLLRYFGEDTPDRCGSCGNCAGGACKGCMPKNAKQNMGEIWEVIQR